MATTRYVLNQTTAQLATWDDASTYYPPLTAGKVATTVMPTQAAIADLNLPALTLLSDVVTAVGTIQTKVNTLLAELRTAGLLTP